MSNRKKQHTDLEVVQQGFANGVAPGFPFTDKEKSKMIDRAAKAYGKFLDQSKNIFRFNLKTNQKAILFYL